MRPPTKAVCMPAATMAIWQVSWGLPGFWTITREITSKCLVTPCCCSSRQKKPSTVRLEYAEHISLTATTSKQFFGLHLWPMLSKGEIASRPGPMMAKSTAVAVEIEGVSAHCGEPEKGKDALEAACKFVSDIYTFKSLYVRDRCVLKFGKMQSGNVRNAISPFSRLDGTMRTFHEETWETLVNAMKSLGEEIEKGIRC